MRIISPFKDYYDSFSQYGAGKEPTYLRTPTQLKVAMERYYSPRGDIHLRPGCVFFCGQLHPFVQISVIRTWNVIGHNIHAYSPSEACEFIERWMTPKEKAMDAKNNGAMKTTIKDIFDGYSRKGWCEKFDHKFDWEKVAAKHVPKACPIAILLQQIDHNMVLNACLQDVEFFKVFPTALAWQELRTWLSNQANPMTPIPKISDHDMAMSKGYDKWSFRKQSKNSKV